MPKKRFLMVLWTSLQATWIRNTTLHALRSTTKVSVHDIPLNFVYNHPTVMQLATFLIGVLTGRAANDKDAARAARLAQMDTMLHKYASAFPTPAWRSAPQQNGSARGPFQETVLVTGTTGRLGSQLLARMLADPAVAQVYTLNRGALTTSNVAKLEERHREVFRLWGLDERLLDDGKVTFLSGDLLKPGFGLDQGTVVKVSAILSPSLSC